MTNMSTIRTNALDGATATARAVRVSQCEPDPDVPADPSAPPTSPVTEADAVRLLTQASFGANASSIDEVMATDYRSWIDRQLALPASLTLPFVREHGNGSLGPPRHYVWWSNAVTQPDQLRQRLAFAWSEIFVVSDIDYELRNAQYAICGYYDMLAETCTGSFREMLERVTLSPVMGIYLSMLRNEKADPSRNIRPDENFAREVLQLFTIGLHELEPDGAPRLRDGEPIPTYDQSTIEQFAKVFTGWNFADTNDWTSKGLTKYDKELPMVPVEEYHDTSEKRLLNGAVLPAGNTARADLEGALDNIVEHPNVGPFIARALIQRLVTSNPTPGYIERVAASFDDNGDGVRGDLTAVTRAILLDTEARSPEAAQATTFGKMKEPIVRLTQLWRAFDAQPGPMAEGRFRTYPKPMDQIGDALGQEPLRSPSVFNFFLPDFPLDASSELVAPELEILSEVDLASTNNILFRLIQSHNSEIGEHDTVTRIDIARELAMAHDPPQLVDHLDLLLTASTAPSAFRLALIDHLDAQPLDRAGRIVRVADAITCFVSAPFHLVQR